MDSASRIVVIVAIGVAGAGAFLWWARPRTPPPTVPALAAAPAPAVVSPINPVPVPVPVSAPVLAPPAIRHPLPAPPAPGLGGSPSLDQADNLVKNALVDLVGRKAVLSFLGADGLVRRLVATADNLATDNAPAQMWPVNRMGGHFETETSGEGRTVISAKNAERYAAFIAFVDGIDAHRAAALYVRLYPIFQQAYEDLGHPGEYFNDRLVTVIDHLLATRDVEQPLAVKRVAVAGVPAARPGQLFLFEDPALEATSTAGQKVLLRIGRDNAAKLKTKLAEIRRLIATADAPPPPRPPR